MPPHLICVGGACNVGSKGNKVKILSTHLESTLLVCLWFKGARGMEALSRGVSCDTIVNVWILWQWQYRRTQVINGKCVGVLQGIKI